jgi:hypothetical protein
MKLDVSSSNWSIHRPTTIPTILSSAAVTAATPMITIPCRHMASILDTIHTAEDARQMSGYSAIDFTISEDAPVCFQCAFYVFCFVLFD